MNKKGAEEHYTDKNSVKCYVTSALPLYIKNQAKASVWHIFGQNPFFSSWNIACFIFFAIFSNGR